MAARISKDRGRSFLAGLGLIGVMALAAVVALSAKGGPPATQHTMVRAAFADVGQLATGDDVRQNSVRIGQVSQIDYSGSEAIVTMELQDVVHVHSDAKAAMWDQSALGQKFVELDPGTEGAGPLNGTIARTRTLSAMDIDQVLDVLDPPTRDATGSAIRELGTGVAGHSKDLHEFLANAPDVLNDTGTVAGALASTDADLPALLGSAQRVSERLVGRTEQLKQLLQRTTTTLQAVAVDGGKPLSEVVAALPDTLTDIRSVHDALRQPLADTQAAMTTLGPGVAALGEATPDLRGVLREGVEPLDKVPGVADKAIPAVDRLTTTFSDARPLVPRLDETLASLNPFLTAIAPYSVDIPTLADGGAGFANDSIYDKNGKVFGAVRILPVIAPGSAAGLVPEGFNPYPAPGTAQNDGSPAGRQNGGGR